MQHPPPLPARNSRRTARRVVLTIVLGFAFCLLASIALLIGWRYSLSESNNRQLRAIRAAGLPANGAELDAWYPAVPDQDNAALLFLDAAEQLVSFADGRTNQMNSFQFPPPREPVAAADRQWMKEYVALNQPVLELARTGLKLSRSRYPVDLTPAYIALLKHLSEVKKLAQAVRYESEVALQSGEPATATESVALILALGRSLDEEPTLISFLVRAALLQSAGATLERTLSATPLSEPELKRLSGLFADAANTNLLARALIGERACAIPTFRMSWAEMRRLAGTAPGSAPGASAPLPGPQPPFVAATGIFERDLGFYLGVMETNIALARLGPPASLKLTELQDQYSQTARKRFYILSAMLLPSLSKAAVREAGSLASLRLATTALAVERFRLANQRLPAKLDDLVPGFLAAIPTDPFDGAPLRFKLLDKGCLLYSVGDDLRDDGGRGRPVPRKPLDKSTYDITFKILR